MARFATRTREQQAEQRERKRAKRERRQRTEEHERRIAAKEAAVAEVKRLRERVGATASETAAADASYREALADLITFETGSPPAWASSAEPSGDVTEPELAEDETPRVDGDDASQETG